MVAAQWDKAPTAEQQLARDAVDATAVGWKAVGSATAATGAVELLMAEAPGGTTDPSRVRWTMLMTSTDERAISAILLSGMREPHTSTATLSHSHAPGAAHLRPSLWNRGSKQAAVMGPEVAKAAR
jgi:hypothetical protein